MDKNKKPKARKKKALTAVVTIRMTEVERARFREANRLVGKTDSEVARKLLVGSPSRVDRKCLTDENAWDYNRAMLVRGNMERIWMCVLAFAEVTDPGDREHAMTGLLDALSSEFEKVDEELQALQLRGFYDPPVLMSLMNTQEERWNFNDY